MSTVTDENSKNNTETALATAKRELGVPDIITARDLRDSEVDTVSVIAYLGVFKKVLCSLHFTPLMNVRLSRHEWPRSECPWHSGNEAPVEDDHQHRQEAQLEARRVARESSDLLSCSNQDSPSGSSKDLIELEKQQRRRSGIPLNTRRSSGIKSALISGEC